MAKTVVVLSTYLGDERRCSRFLLFKGFVPLLLLKIDIRVAVIQFLRNDDTWEDGAFFAVEVLPHFNKLGNAKNDYVFFVS